MLLNGNRPYMFSLLIDEKEANMKNFLANKANK